MNALRKFILVTIIVLFCSMMVGYGCKAAEPVIPEYTFKVDDTFAVILNVSGSLINGFVTDISFDPAYLKYVSYDVLSTNPFPFFSVNDSTGLVQGIFGMTGGEALASIDANIFEAAFTVKQEGETYVKLTKAVGYKSLDTLCDYITKYNPDNKIIGEAISVPTDESTIIFKLIFEKR